MQFCTPLRYPGGKGRLTQVVANLMKENGLAGGHYVEPYAGGAGVAVSLLLLEYASHVHINDLNRSVHAFWHSVLNETDELCSMIRSRRVSMAEWRRQRAVQNDPSAGNLELAYSTFFLNRTNRSGIILGGVIGGKNQDGPYKLDARYNKLDMVQRIERIAAFKSRISLYNLDTLALIKRVLPKVPRRSLVYFDPPYYVKGKGLYENHYAHVDHVKVGKAVSSIEQPWIVSYDNVPEIRSIYADYRSKVFGLQYSAQSRYEGSEIMFFSDGLKTPSEVIPSRAMAA